MKKLVLSLAVLISFGALSSLSGQLIGPSFSDMIRYENDYQTIQETAKRQLGPEKSEVEKHKAFLKRPKTGIFRLVLPMECPLGKEEMARNRIKVAEQCPRQILRGGGSNYSFRRKEYVWQTQADLTIKGNVFYSMGISSQGIMVKLGDVPLDDVSLDIDGVRYLNDFLPAISPEDADIQTARINKGIQDGNFLYARGFTIKVNNTFALRVVAYRGNMSKDIPMTSTEQLKTETRIRNGSDQMLGSPQRASIEVTSKSDPLFGDVRNDIIVALRVVKVGTDGSVTIIWRELQTKQSPTLDMSKRK